jgi:ABC-type cobalamin/Fe3+-siderophores transport system ATPase subunit
MDAEITIKNYRCFPDTKPVRVIVRDGFTAFLGVNNSGKSSLLKFFYELRNVFGSLSQPGNNIAEALRAAGVYNPPTSVGELEELFYNGNERGIQVTIKLLNLATEYAPGQPIATQFVLTIPRGSNSMSLEVSPPSGASHQGKSNIGFNNGVLMVDGVAIADLSPFFSLCCDLASTVYIGPFRNAINAGTKTDYFDIDVGQGFIQRWRQFKTGNSSKQNEATYQLTQDICRIFGFRQLEINPSPDDQTLKFFVNGKSYPLSALGSGLAQFVLVLANAATKRPAFILIDEPELNLHPSLQLDFLTTLGSYARRGVLFATHSYGLARARAQSVYTLQADGDDGSDVRPLESTPRLSELLGELSFSAYRELGFDKILLVEGVTDVLTVQQFLRMHNKDHKVVLLPMGGNSLIDGSREQELREIRRITENVHALIDSERDAASATLARNRQEFREACQKAHVKCHVLDRRATENYLTDPAVKAIMGAKHRALGPHEALKALDPRWAKGDNWRIARMMKKEDLDGTDLGQFLASL